MSRLASILLLLALAALLGACGSEGSYELRWSIACVTGQPAACPVKTAKDCAAVGFDAVAVVAVRGSERTRSLFPCFGPLGPVGEGPGLASGARQPGGLGALAGRAAAWPGRWPWPRQIPASGLARSRSPCPGRRPAATAWTTTATGWSTCWTPTARARAGTRSERARLAPAGRPARLPRRSGLLR